MISMRGKNPLGRCVSGLPHFANEPHAHGVIVRAMSRFYVEAPAQSAVMLGFSGYSRQIIIPAIAWPVRAFERKAAIAPFHTTFLLRVSDCCSVWISPSGRAC